MWRTTIGSGARPCPPHGCIFQPWCLFPLWISEHSCVIAVMCSRARIASPCCAHVATEKQALRTFQRLHNTAVLGGAHVLRAQVTAAGDWPPGVAPVGDRTVPSLPSYLRHHNRRGGQRHLPAQKVGNTSWGRRVPDRVAPALNLCSKAAGASSSSSTPAVGRGWPSLLVPRPPPTPPPPMLVPRPPPMPPPPHLARSVQGAVAASDASEAAPATPAGLGRPVPPWRKRAREE